MKVQEKLDIALQYIALGLKIQPIHWVGKTNFAHVAILNVNQPVNTRSLNLVTWIHQMMKM